MTPRLHRPRLSASRCLVLVSVVLTILVALVGIDARASHASPSDQDLLIAPRDAIMLLPTSGADWDALVTAADKPLVPDLADQNNRTSAYAVAAGLVYVRTGDPASRTKVVEALQALPGTEFGRGSRTLALGRQLAGWVLAADLVDYREPAFVTWVDGIRTAEIGGHGRWYALTQTHENSANNWGTFAGASRLAASLYVGDVHDVAQVAERLASLLGEDTDAWPGRRSGESAGGFQPTSSLDISWSCTGENWTPLNSGCEAALSDLDGGLVEELSRSSTSWPDDPDRRGFGYSWEALQGIALQGILLHQNGYPDVWAWSNQGPLRAVDYLHRNGAMEGASFHRVNHWVPWVVDSVYDTSYANGPAGDGRQFGFTDWLGPAIATVSPTNPLADGHAVGSEQEPGLDSASRTERHVAPEREDRTEGWPGSPVEAVDTTAPEIEPVTQPEAGNGLAAEPGPVPDDAHELPPVVTPETEPRSQAELEPEPTDDLGSTGKHDTEVSILSPGNSGSIVSPFAAPRRPAGKIHRIDLPIAVHHWRAKMDAAPPRWSLRREPPDWRADDGVSARGPRRERTGTTQLASVLPQGAPFSSWRQQPALRLGRSGWLPRLVQPFSAVQQEPAVTGSAVPAVDEQSATGGPDFLAHPDLSRDVKAIPRPSHWRPRP